MSKISVIVPVYNTADYLEKCLDSIFSQSGVDLEVILDHERNRGLSAARNTGMEVMTGEKFFFLDSDDWLPEGALQAMNQVAESGMDLVIGSYENCYQNHSTTAPARAAIYPTRRSVEDNFFEINFTNATNKLISSKFAGVRFCENLIFEDNLWAMQVYETVESVAVVERATYCRRMRKDSITRSSYSAQKIESLLYIVTTLAASANADKNCRHTAVYMALTLIKNIFMTDFPSDYRKEILRKLFATGVCKMYCNRDVLPPLTGAMSRLLPMRRRWIFELLFRVYKLTNR